MIRSRAEKLALLTTAFGLLHHADHVLRFNHSGWPFRPEVGVFTYTLAVYPVIALVLLARGWPRLRIGLAALLTLFPTLSHIFVETPAEQYRTWATEPSINLLGIRSPALGVVAVTITVLLSLSALAVFLAFVRSRGV
jgi:hypothetical protein